jgi:hypothetical protein
MVRQFRDRRVLQHIVEMGGERRRFDHRRASVSRVTASWR